jgi:PIN domain nuclease of toxin-antitoxin system
VKHLLDTNAWLRAVGAINELNSGAQAILMAHANAPFALSAISVWEVSTKFRKKPHQLSLTLPLDGWLAKALNPRFVKVIPIDAELARLSNELPGSFHEDPADRMIVATARRAGLVLVTSDELIIKYPHVESLDTR